ncbi:hypothetical protein BGZ63DRAFT_427964 [Mariannaea sp. PMI_226]|nr:hypothetical protein BGZ63DRAFT_427964 [Mariannaea sp. PMI_226]
MSFSPLARRGLHASANFQGFFRPETLPLAPLYPRPRLIPKLQRFRQQISPEAPSAPDLQEPYAYVSAPAQSFECSAASFPNTRRSKELRLEDKDKARTWPCRRRHSKHKTSPEDSAISSTAQLETVVINGHPTRKRFAQTTEFELVASINDIETTNPPVVITREGEIIPSGISDENSQIQNSMRWTAIFTFFSRMILNLPSAFSGFAGKLEQLFHRKSYGVAECRTYIDRNQVVSNKRVKLSHDEDLSDIRWIDHSALNKLIDDYKAFSQGIGHVWGTIAEHSSTKQIDKILAPISHALADNDLDRVSLVRGEHELYELFQLQFRRAFSALDQIYEIGVIVKISKDHALVPSTMDYDLSPENIELLGKIKAFLSAPALPTICNDILKLADSKHSLISEPFFDQIVLDLEAILNKLPAPSYVLSSDFRKLLQETFGLPQRTDLETQLILPGTFPDSDDPESVPLLQQEIVIEPASIKSSQPETKPPATEWIPPATSKPQSTNRDWEEAHLRQRRIEETDPAQFRRNFYQEGTTHKLIESNYLADLTLKDTLTLDETSKLRSILKSKRRAKHPKRLTHLHNTPKPAKKVRFTDSVLSPRPRTHLGLDVPKKFSPLNSALESDIKVTVEPEDNEREDIGVLALLASRHRERRQKSTDKENIPPDYDARIAEVFAQPSPKPLLISDDSQAGIRSQKEQAALKAAEEARKKAEAERLAAEEKAKRELEQRLAASGGLRLPTRRFVLPVSTGWQNRALETLRAASSTTLATTAEGVDLRRHDFAKVVPPTEWLNDEIVNGSLNWLDQAVNAAAGIKDVKKFTRKCLAMSSFFFKRLQDQGVTRTQRTLRRYGVEKRNFLDVDTILMPICEHSHWTLLVIRPSKRTVAHMDSLNPQGNRAYINLALAWIKDVLEEKFVQDEWEVKRHQAPMQTNGYDCGVHTITNGMCLALGLSPMDCYTAQDMPRQRIRLACMLLNGGFKGDFDLRLF